ncbi:hypothetical protein BP6252_10555 [Coleophoma cylindrospora]|uniref:UBC core domain-containing protein n=1 Tax=Coleophoma cylindrospora TaxID=1849047 RepID=A0A3D8QTQ4_9HELO|nr:hypothetical protein BP6252_10555 [Coleophoma cylindrospora]
MPRKAFVADVAAAAESDIPGIVSISRGADDGDVNFDFVPNSGERIELALLATGKSIDLHLPNADLTSSANTSKNVTNILEKLASCTQGMNIPELITTISNKLCHAIAGGESQETIKSAEADEDLGNDDDSEDSLGDYESDDGFGPFGGLPTGNSRGPAYNPAAPTLSPQLALLLNTRIRKDLRDAKFANFKIGILSGMKAQTTLNILSMSVHASKLGLSEEAMQAWDIEPTQYIVLLVKYGAGYKTFESVISEPSKSLEICFRVGVCNRYKPSFDEAFAAFTEVNHNVDSTRTEIHDGNQQEIYDTEFKHLFISSSLNDLMNSQFISLVKIRNSYASIGWNGAKKFLDDNQSRVDEATAHIGESAYSIVDESPSTLPDMVTADHMFEAARDGLSVSFPLIAGQFALSHLVRCTEFCLVCHNKVDSELEALKPYVCDRPLCLYQYMSLGFGPSVEHEIMTQPYVVDLLVSFCYTSVKTQRMREYPNGMCLSVPHMQPSGATQQYYVNGAAQPIYDSPDALPIQIDVASGQVVFERASTVIPVRDGDWVVIVHPSLPPQHGRIVDCSRFPNVRFVSTDEAGSRAAYMIPGVNPTTPAITPPPPGFVQAKLIVYETNFDDLSKESKNEIISLLLDSLPPMRDMRAYLASQSRKSTPCLRNWKDRVSPAALGLLRWIIASNRSCIIQVDKCPGQDEDDIQRAKIRLDQKLTNVSSDWVQFRFAQGSPDKERRFLQALKAQQDILKQRYPTIFAFHGSPVGNWHSIIRHGLDFKETLHGRAYGHGVYHSQDQNVCLSYAHGFNISWPGSELKIQSAMSLNELVNCTSQFTSVNPYIVCQFVDWIQCRYLLVRTMSGPVVETGSPDSGTMTPAFTDKVEQDPEHLCKSTSREVIGVPASAVAISRKFRIDDAQDRTTKKSKPSSGSRSHGSIPVDWVLTDETDIDDIQILLSDCDLDHEADKGKEKETENVSTLINSTASSASMTDFVPGSLDQATLPMLKEPAYATRTATLSLNRELQKMLKIQKSIPTHELGWYINPDLMDNIYQWIVEMHSFDPELPLAKDMRTAGVTSIVFEIRFGKDYPHSPPFIRVIRPRFLPFMSGGGGHVTGGGAMCMELLTNTGWSAVNSLESVLLQVRLALMNLEPKPARLNCLGKKQARNDDYNTGEAIQAYLRACHAHGWEVPKDFRDFGSS